MGLMSGNPYYTGNAFAEGINSFIGNMNSELDRSQSNKIQDAQLKQQAEVLRMAKEKALQDELEAGQKMDERLMYQQAQGELQTRLAPRPLVDANGIPTDLGEGLMPPEFKEQYRGPYADPSQAVQRVSNPAWGETLGALQERKEVPALPISTPELASFGVRMGDKNILEKLIPKENTLRNDLFKSGKYDPDSIDPFIGGTGKLKFAKDPAVVTWSEPYTDRIGGKLAKVQKSSTGQVRPIFEDKSTTIIQREPSRHTEFKDVMALRKEFSDLPEVKDYATIQAQGMRAKKALEESLNNRSNMPVDQTVITTFNKLLDPSSVVRESEYARTPQDLAVLSRIKGKWNKVTQGGAGLDLDERQALVRMIGNFSEIADVQYQDQVAQYTELAKRNGFSPNDVIRLGYKPKPPASGKQPPLGKVGKHSYTVTGQ